MFGTIYAGNVKKDSKGNEVWTKKEDVTNDAIQSVFEWFMQQSKKEKDSIYEISFKGYGTLTYDPNGKIEKAENSACTTE